MLLLVRSLARSTHRSDSILPQSVPLISAQISDFLTFFDRLEHSIQRDLSKIELIRMRLAHEAITTDFIDVELIELKFNFDRCAYSIERVIFSALLTRNLSPLRQPRLRYYT